MRYKNFHIGRDLRSCGLLVGMLLLAAVVHAQEIPPLEERLQLCAGCHNPDGNSIIPENPKLSGLDVDYITRQLKDFKSGSRHSNVMVNIIPLVDEKEYKSLAVFFSIQKRTNGTAADETLVAKGKLIFNDGILGSAVPACAGCHNEDGSGSAKYPRLTGQNTPYVIQQLLDFKNGVRTNDAKAAMRAVAKRMNEDEIIAVAHYVSTLKEAEE